MASVRYACISAWALLTRAAPGSVLRSKEVFFKQLAKRTPFTPPGELVERFKLHSEDYDVYLVCGCCGACGAGSHAQCTIDTPGFRVFFERLQPFAVWYIETANYVGLLCGVVVVSPCGSTVQISTTRSGSSSLCTYA